MRVRTIVLTGVLGALALTAAGAGLMAIRRVQAQEIDVHYLVRQLSQHPMLGQAGKRAAFMSLAEKSFTEAREPLPEWRLLLIEDKLVRWFGDPHTYLGLEFGSERVPERVPERWIPVLFYWAPDGLVAIRTEDAPRRIRTGDRVLSILRGADAHHI